MGAATGQPVTKAESAGIVPVEIGKSPDCSDLFVPAAMNDGDYPFSLTIVGSGYCDRQVVPYGWTNGNWARYARPPVDPGLAVAATSISEGRADAATVTLVAGDPDFYPEVWVSTGGQPAIELPALDGETRAVAAVVSSGGAHIAGTLVSVSDPAFCCDLRAVRWTRVGSDWSLTEDFGYGLATAISADGSMVLGSDVGGNSWVWTESPQGGERVWLDSGASAWDISHSGSIIVGTRENPDASGSGVLPAPAYWVREGAAWQLHGLPLPEWAATGSPAWAVAVAEVDGQEIIVGNIGSPSWEGITHAIAWIPGADGGYGAPIALDSLDDSPSGRAEVVDINRNGTAVGLSSIPGDNMESTAVMWQVVDRPQRPINVGHAGAWYDPETPGQGLLVDIEPSDQSIFLAWFTYTASAPGMPGDPHWYTAQGHYSGDTAEVGLFETLGGQFDGPTETTTNHVGYLGMRFSDCDQLQFSYWILADDRENTIDLQRVIPGSDKVCDQKSAGEPGTQSVDINDGMDGAWTSPNTPGQGFLIDAHRNPDGSNFIFVAWFTYGDGTASGQRWLTAQGAFSGGLAGLQVHETTGGRFDDPQSAETREVGRMDIDFSDCSNAWLSYSLDDDALEGAKPITRLVPGGQALCEELSVLE